VTKFLKVALSIVAGIGITLAVTMLCTMVVAFVLSCVGMQPFSLGFMVTALLLVMVSIFSYVFYDLVLRG
jgi:hypothetical protein